MKEAIVVSGYFNPIHKGHIEYFKNARANGDELFVIVNSDFQRAWEGSTEFQDENERVFIVESLRLVDKCFLSIDKDRTVVESIKIIFNQFGNEYQLQFEGENETATVLASTNYIYTMEFGKVVVTVDPEYYRPTEVDLLIGDPTKSKK